MQFEERGCPIRSATPGRKLERVPYIAKHEQFMNLIYDLVTVLLTKWIA